MVLLSELIDRELDPRLASFDLKKNNYGFPKDQRVAISPDKFNQLMSTRAQEVYRRIIQDQDLTIADLIESVGFIINHSMRYDYEFLNAIRGVVRPDVVESEQEHYAPTGEEVTKGLCHDAGNLIRELLGSLNLESRYIFARITCPELSNGTINHDTTLVVDHESGRWAAINSKYPALDYNVVPEEELSGLGEPYGQID